jgi:hypothetical protein
MSEADLFNALIAWAGANAQLTGRIKELALFERGDPEFQGEVGAGDEFAAVMDAAQGTRQAPRGCPRDKGVGREFPPDLLADVPTEDRP